MGGVRVEFGFLALGCNPPFPKLIDMEKSNFPMAIDSWLLEDADVFHMFM